MSENDDALWRRRLLTYSAVRLAGLAIFFLGVAIIYTDLVRKGGAPQLGAVVALIGAFGALITPHLLKKAWDDRER